MIFVFQLAAGTISGQDSDFILTVPEGIEALVFSFIGKTSKEVSIIGKTSI